MKLKLLEFLIICTLLLRVGFANPVINSVIGNANSVGLYNKFELTVNLTASFSNPYDYDQIKLQAVFTSPSSESDTVDGFYYQSYNISGSNAQLIPNGAPVWKIRFAPTEIGTWTYEIYCTDSTGTGTYPVQTFGCETSENPGFVRVANDQYFRFDNNTQFFAIGENIGWYGPGTIYDYRDWMNALSVNGANYFRLWMCSWAFAIEWNDTGLGDYQNRQDRAFQLDWVVDYARQKGMYIQICLNNHGQLSSSINPEWANNPYNSANGGPCEYPWQFFTNSAAKDYYLQRMRYIIARWGYATNILSWELFNEADLTDDYSYHSNENIQWHDQMAQFLKDADVNDHLVTTSYGNVLNEPDTWNLTNIDYTQIHHYSIASDVQSVHDGLVNSYLNDFNKPTIIGEFGFPSSEWSVNNDPDGINLHNSLWASVVSGAFGTASTWWWDGYIDPRNLYYHFSPVSNFISSVDLLSQTFTPVVLECNSGVKVDLNVAPGFASWAKSPANDFTVQPNGWLSPPATELGRYLFGTTWNSQLRNPPTFHVNYPQSGQFRIITGNTGTAPTIVIRIDGNQVLSVPGYANSTYSVDVDSGEHEIFVDNQGTDWIEIPEYIFTDYVPAIRSFALRGNTETIGWVQNRNYNWKYVRDVGIPGVIDDGTITITGLNDDGIYGVEWYSCSTGTTVTTDTVAAVAGTVTVNVPALQWDYAYRLTFQPEVKIVSPGVVPSRFALKQNFPNPFNTGTSIPYDISQPGFIELSIYDVTGKFVRRLVHSKQSPGSYIITWDGKNDEDLMVPSGTYLYQLKVNGKVVEKKRMILAK